MLLFATVLVIAVGLLVWGADRFVAGASALARNLGVPPLVVGLTVVGIGTSGPELVVSAMAAWQGSIGIAVGNAVGSNIANTTLVLGVTALVAPVTVGSRILRRELPLMLLVILLAWALLLDGRLTRADGALLMGGFVALLAWMVTSARRGESDPLGEEFQAAIPRGLRTGAALLRAGLGLIALLGASRAVVWAAVGIARALDVSDLVVGLTVVAVGTSLPELAASVVSALRKEPDIAIGNVIGSNMFNMLPVLGLPGLIAPGAVDPAVATRDFPVMVGLSLALFAMAYGFRAPGRISRGEGTTLVIAFCVYESLLYRSSL